WVLRIRRRAQLCVDLARNPALPRRPALGLRQRATYPHRPARRHRRSLRDPLGWSRRRRRDGVERAASAASRAAGAEPDSRLALSTGGNRHRRRDVAVLVPPAALTS